MTGNCKTLFPAKACDGTPRTRRGRNGRTFPNKCQEYDMSETDYLESRIRELADRTYKNEYTVNTEFLSISEQASFYEALKKLGVPADSDRVFGVRFTLQGGYDDAERRAAFFLPSWLDTETFIRNEQTSPDLLTCLHISPLQKKFSDPLTHRDYLGALMSLGIERDRTGDILIDHEDHSAYIFIFKNIAEIVCRELVRVRHTSVSAEEIPPIQCTVRPSFEIREGSVASERLDAVLSFVLRLARAKAQELIAREDVYVNGRTARSGGAVLREGVRVSVKGHGKFIYEGVLSSTKKGRDFIRVRVFK